MQYLYITFKNLPLASLFPRFSILLLTWLLTACVNEVSEPSTDVNQQSASPGTVLRSGEFDASESCPQGGVKIDIGLDTNQNGELDEGEVQQQYEICHGVAGTDGLDGENGTDGTNGLNSLVALSAELPGDNCTYGGTRIDAGIDQDGNGSLESSEIATTDYICEYQACQWIDNGDGTTTVNCPDGNTEVVLNPEALEFTEQLSCIVSIRKPGTTSETIPMLYTIDKISSQLKFVSLTILDGQQQSTNSRLLTTTHSGFGNSRIGLFFDNVGDANGGLYQAQIREGDNLIDFTYIDSDLESGGYLASFVALDSGTDEGICSQVFPAAD